MFSWPARLPYVSERWLRVEIEWWAVLRARYKCPAHRLCRYFLARLSTSTGAGGGGGGIGGGGTGPQL